VTKYVQARAVARTRISYIVKEISHGSQSEGVDWTPLSAARVAPPPCQVKSTRFPRDLDWSSLHFVSREASRRDLATLPNLEFGEFVCTQETPLNKIRSRYNFTEQSLGTSPGTTSRLEFRDSLEYLDKTKSQKFYVLVW